MSELETFVKQELEAAGGNIVYADLLGRVMAEHPTQRQRLPRALVALRSAGVLHETVGLAGEPQAVVHTIVAGKRPENVGVSDG